MTTDAPKTQLLITEGGRWLVRSESRTVCHPDLDRMLLKRVRGAGSPVLPFEGEWVRLVRITSIAVRDTGVVRVGDRTEYLTDAGADVEDYQWWVPRMCTAIEPDTTNSAGP